VRRVHAGKLPRVQHPRAWGNSRQNRSASCYRVAWKAGALAAVG
jgi:hypothetical protein